MKYLDIPYSNALLYLGINVFERHDILVNSIGALPQEIEAFEQMKWMLGLSYSLLLICAILQMVSYYFYNGKFHPFADILLPETKCKYIKPILMLNSL